MRATAQPPSPLTAVSVYIVAILYFFFTIIQLSMFNTLSPHLLRDFSLSSTGLGWLSSIYLYTLVVVLLPTGVLVDRYLTRRPALISLLLAATGCLIFAYHPGLTTAAIYRVTGGIGNGFAFVCAMRVSNYWFPNKKALASSLAVSLGLLGGMVTGAPLAHFIESTTWQFAMMANAFTGITLFVLLALFLKNHPSEHTEGETISFNDVKGVVKNTQNLLCGLYTGCLNTALFVLAALWGNLYLTQRFGLSTLDAATVTSMIFLGTIIGSPLCGTLSDRLGKRKLPMVIGGIASIASFCLIIFAGNLSFYSLIALFLVLGFTTSTQVISYPTIAESNPIRLISTATSLAAMLIDLVAGILQVMLGWILTWHWDGRMHNSVPIYTAHNWHMALYVVLFVFCFGLACVLRVRETQCKSSLSTPPDLSEPGVATT